MKDKKKAAEEVQRLVNTNFTDKDIKIINNELFNILEKSKILVPYSRQ